MLELRDMFRQMVELNSSDLHLVVGAPPQLRIRGALATIEGYDILTPEDVREIVFGILTNEQRQKLEVQWEIDFSYAVPGLARWRVNAFYQRGAVGAAFRIIPEEVRPLSDLGVPDAAFKFTELTRGLVLVTGPTGSGKSTTLAGIIDVINEQRDEHILTVEDPIEFIHPHKNCVINQREVGTDTEGFARALKSALRQDPDIILVGEMRDLDTIQTALTAAETGHLVFGTLHTSTAAKTVDRIIDVFPPHQQEQVRVQLASSLQGVLSQVLLPTADGEGRVLACEVMIPNNAIRNLIREGKIFQIPSVMQTSQGDGMQTLDAALATLVRAGQITTEIAMRRTHEPEEFARLLQNGGGAPPSGRTPYMKPDSLRLQKKLDAAAAFDDHYDAVAVQQPSQMDFNPLGVTVGSDPTAGGMPQQPGGMDPAAQQWAAPAAPAGFQPDPNAFQPDPNAFQPDPNAFQMDPNAGHGMQQQPQAGFDPNAAHAAPAAPAPLMPGQMPDLPSMPGAMGQPQPGAAPAAFPDAPAPGMPPADAGMYAAPAPPMAPSAVPIDPATGQPWQPPGEVA